MTGRELAQWSELNIPGKLYYQKGLHITCSSKTKFKKKMKKEKTRKEGRKGKEREGKLKGEKKELSIRK